jgi:hypothetical protein
VVYNPRVRPPFRTTLAAAALVAAVASFAASGGGPPVYDPDPTQADAGRLEGETWSRESATVGIALTRIDDATRTGFIRRRTGLEFDPFMTSPGAGRGFVTFHILVENRGETRVVFEPQACRLETSYRDSEGPIDYPTLVTAFDMTGRAVPPDLERIRAAIPDGQIVLERGEKRDGLLVFRGADPKAKRFHVEVGVTVTSGDRFGFVAHYKKRKK